MKTFSELMSKIQEDVGTSDMTQKKWVDRYGNTRTRTYPAHRVDFRASKAQAEPAQKDAPPK